MNDQPPQFPLTPPQIRLWRAEQVENKSLAVFSFDRTLPVGGAMAPWEVARSFIARHESLRSRIVMRDGVPHVVIDGPELAGTYLHESAPDVERPTAFDLPGPLAAAFVEAGHDGVRVEFRVHHLMIDFLGCGILARDFDAFADGESKEEVLQPSRYATVEALASYEENLVREQEEFSKKFVPERTGKARTDPIDGARFRDGRMALLAIPDSAAEAVDEVKKRFRASDFVAWHAAIGLMLSWHLGISSIAAHSVTVNRNSVKDMRTVACRAGVSVFDISLPDDKTATSYIKKIQREMLRVFMRSPYDVRRLLEHLEKSAPPRTHPCAAGTNLMYPLSRAGQRSQDLYPRKVMEIEVIEAQDGLPQGEHLSLTLGRNRGVFVARVVTSSALPAPEATMRDLMAAMRFLADDPVASLTDFTL